jgi:hypothetical protein
MEPEENRDHLTSLPPLRNPDLLQKKIKKITTDSYFSRKA